MGFRVPGEASLYWQHPDLRQAVRVVHLEGRVIGLNFMGLRFFHETAEAWIAKVAELDVVLSGLHQGNFDPEFAPDRVSDAIESLQAQWRETVA